MTLRVLVVQPELEDPPALFGAWLVAAGCVLDVRQPFAGDRLPSLGDEAPTYDAVLVLGGAMSANDDDVLGWIAPVKALLRDAVAQGVPTLGICLGHQLLASALGGRVVPNPLGQQVGLLPVGWTAAAADDPLFASIATPRRGVQWNNDLVVESPPGTVVLAATAHGELQVARFAPTAWGIQLHPEVDAAIVATWVSDTEREALAGRGLDADALVADIHAARPELDAAWRPLADAFADVVVGAGSRAAHG